MKTLSFFVATLLLTFSPYFSFSQQLLNTEKPSSTEFVVDPGIIELSKPVFDEIMDWAGQKNQSVPIEDHLRSKSHLNQDEIDYFLKKHLGGSQAKTDNQSIGTGDCHCSVMSVTPAHEMTPPDFTSSTTGNSYSQGLLGEWEYSLTRQRHGVANRHVLSMNGGHMSGEYQATTSGTQNSSSSLSKFLLGYLCTSSGNLPDFCGCEKVVDLTGRYESEMYVYNSVGGPWSKGSYAKIEESVVFFTYEKIYDGNTDNEIEGAEVLSSSHALITRNTVSTWNPGFWIELFELAETVLGVVLIEDNTVDAEFLSDVNDQLVDVITTPFYQNYGSMGDGSAANTMTMHYDGQVTLTPNSVRHIAMVSNGLTYGRGYGGSWSATSRKSSNFFMSVVIPFDDSEPNCCIEKTGRWMMADMPFSPNTEATMQEAIAPIMTVFGPWANLSDDDFNGNVDINSPIGIAISDPQCPDCSTLINQPYLTPAGPLVAECPSTEFTLTAVGPTADLYHFEKDGDLHETTTSSSIVVDQPGNYRVYLEKDGCTSPLSDAVTVIMPLPTKPSLVIGSETLCEGIATTLSLDVDALPGGEGFYNNILWSGPNISQTGTDYIVEISQTGYYGVSLYTDCGIVSSPMIYIEFEDCTCSPEVQVTGLDASNNWFVNSVDLTWDALTEVMDYRLLVVRTNPNGPTVVFNNYVSQNYYLNFPVQAGADYYFRVRARCEDGTFSQWSGVHTFGLPGHGDPLEKNAVETIALSEWSAFPNPADDVVQFSFDGKLGSPSTLELFDVSGRIVTTNVLNDQTSINIGHLPQGLYMAKIMGSDGNVQTIKIMKK